MIDTSTNQLNKVGRQQLKMIIENENYCYNLKEGNKINQINSN